MTAFYHGINQVESIFSSSYCITKQPLKLPGNSMAFYYLGASDKAMNFHFIRS